MCMENAEQAVVPYTLDFDGVLTFLFVEDLLDTLKNVIKERELNKWNLYHAVEIGT